MATRKVRPIDPAQKYCSPRQAAKAMGCSEYLIYREVGCGHVPHRKLGDRILIPVDWVMGGAARP